MDEESAVTPDLPTDNGEREKLEAIRKLREFSRGRPLHGLTFRELIDEGRRS